MNRQQSQRDGRIAFLRIASGKEGRIKTLFVHAFLRNTWLASWLVSSSPMLGEAAALVGDLRRLPEARTRIRRGDTPDRSGQTGPTASVEPCFKTCTPASSNLAE
jgi:hypothetical protein